MTLKLPKFVYIIVLMTALASIFWVYFKMNEMTEESLPTHVSKTNLQNEHHPTVIPQASIDPHTNHNLCTFRPVTPEEAAEEKLLLHSIAWPETPPFSAFPSLDESSDPAHSTFIILPRKGGGRGEEGGGGGKGQWHVGDQLEVLINIRDFHGRPKKYGGDFLLARLHSPDLDAGVAGAVMDHLNGSYTAVFPLLWEGSAHVQVTLVHPSEAVTVLRWLNREHPDRITYESAFKSGSVRETTACHICLRPSQQPLCNYTDPRTGEPWFCYKPKKLSCDTRISHGVGEFKDILRPNDNKLFGQGINMKVYIPPSGPATITVLPKREGLNIKSRRPSRTFTRPTQADQREVDSISGTSGPSGYYYQGVWRSLGSTTVQQFNTPAAVRQCLSNKLVYMFGDSTIRQWFEYLLNFLPDLKEFNLPSSKQSGPRLALDHKNTIMMTYRCHGLPVRFNTMSTEQHYIANELDSLPGGSRTVVVFTVWSHFTNFPMEVYTRRVMSIRRAVVSLLLRSPDTVIIIRTANLKQMTLNASVTKSDWYSIQRDKVLREMFKGLKVHLVDAWAMTLAHKLPHNLHPERPIIRNMVNVVLSHICEIKR